MEGCCIKGWYVIPKTSTIILVFLQEYHSWAIGGHGGDVKTYLRIAHEWFWGEIRNTMANSLKDVRCVKETSCHNRDPA